MTLRRKLLVAFGGLAALAFLAAAVTVYLTVRWHSATQEQRAHYTRSLLLQSVRAETFQALAEVNDALAGAPDDYADARGDFERAIAETDANFAEWRSLAGDMSESAEIREVRAAYERLTDYARQVFDLLDAGRRNEAVRLVDDELDTGDYAQFQAVTEAAAAADARVREEVTAASETLRLTALIMSAVIAIAVLSLTLLIAAYLAQDLFRPLSQLRHSLNRLAEGETRERLPVNRSDEFGAVAAAFNGAAEAFERRSEPANPPIAGKTRRTSTPDDSMHAILRGAAIDLRSSIASLDSEREETADARVQRLSEEAEALERAVMMAVPSELRLDRLDPRLCVQEALAAMAPVLAARGTSCECELEDSDRQILADRARLREILAELLHSALSALPERGGRIGLRVRADDDDRRLHLDVASGGGGRDLDDRPGAASHTPPPSRVPSQMALRIVRDHGGTIEQVEGADGARVVRLSFPMLRTARD